ncbi:MAG: hypothetical protein K0B09_04860 [Bacteroidales bacterium]|nr:hypothetical protein [Bacteroidales bacterium]
MKRFALAMIAVFFFFGCGQQPATQEEVVIETFEIAELISNPMEYEEQEIRIEGIISHICRHSGEKMRVAEIDGEGLSILVMLGDFAPQFNPEFEGQEVILTGVLKTTIQNIDALNEEHVHGEDGEDCDHEGEEHAHEEGHDDCESTQEAIAKMKAAGIDPDIAAHIEITSFEIK